MRLKVLLSLLSLGILHEATSVSTKENRKSLFQSLDSGKGKQSETYQTAVSFQSKVQFSQAVDQDHQEGTCDKECVHFQKKGKESQEQTQTYVPPSQETITQSAGFEQDISYTTNEQYMYQNEMVDNSTYEYKSSTSNDEDYIYQNTYSDDDASSTDTTTYTSDISSSDNDISYSQNNNMDQNEYNTMHTRVNFNPNVQSESQSYDNDVYLQNTTYDVGKVGDEISNNFKKNDNTEMNYQAHQTEQNYNEETQNVDMDYAYTDYKSNDWGGIYDIRNNLTYVDKSSSDKYVDQTSNNQNYNQIDNDYDQTNVLQKDFKNSFNYSTHDETTLNSNVDYGDRTSVNQEQDYTNINNEFTEDTNTNTFNYDQDTSNNMSQDKYSASSYETNLDSSVRDYSNKETTLTNQNITQNVNHEQINSNTQNINEINFENKDEVSTNAWNTRNDIKQDFNTNENNLFNLTDNSYVYEYGLEDNSYNDQSYEDNSEEVYTYQVFSERSNDSLSIDQDQSQSYQYDFDESNTATNWQYENSQDTSNQYAYTDYSQRSSKQTNQEFTNNQDVDTNIYSQNSNTKQEFGEISNWIDDSETNFNINLNLDLDILDWVDNSLEQWESYQTSNTDFSQDNYDTTYNYENKSQIISTGNTNYQAKSTNIKADRTTQSLQNDQDVYTMVNQGHIGDASETYDTNNVQQQFDSDVSDNDNSYTNDIQNSINSVRQDSQNMNYDVSTVDSHDMSQDVKNNVNKYNLEKTDMNSYSEGVKHWEADNSVDQDFANWEYSSYSDTSTETFDYNDYSYEDLSYNDESYIGDETTNNAQYEYLSTSNDNYLNYMNQESSDISATTNDFSQSYEESSYNDYSYQHSQYEDNSYNDYGYNDYSYSNSYFNDESQSYYNFEDYSFADYSYDQSSYNDESYADYSYENSYYEDSHSESVNNNLLYNEGGMMNEESSQQSFSNDAYTNDISSNNYNTQKYNYNEDNSVEDYSYEDYSYDNSYYSDSYYNWENINQPCVTVNDNSYDDHSYEDNSQKEETTTTLSQSYFTNDNHYWQLDHNVNQDLNYQYADYSYASSSYEDYSYDDYGYSTSTNDDYSVNKGRHEYATYDQTFDNSSHSNSNAFTNNNQDLSTTDMNNYDYDYQDFNYEATNSENYQSSNTYSDNDSSNMKYDLNQDYSYDNQELAFSDDDQSTSIDLQQDINTEYQQNLNESLTIVNQEQSSSTNTNENTLYQNSYDDHSYDNYETTDLKMSTENDIYNQNQDYAIDYSSAQSISDDDTTTSSNEFLSYDSSGQSQEYNIENSLDQSVQNNFTSSVDVDKDRNFWVENNNKEQTYDIQTNLNNQDLNEYNYDLQEQIYQASNTEEYQNDISNTNLQANTYNVTHDNSFRDYSYDYDNNYEDYSYADSSVEDYSSESTSYQQENYADNSYEDLSFKDYSNEDNSYTDSSCNDFSYTDESAKDYSYTDTSADDYSQDDYSYAYSSYEDTSSKDYSYKDLSYRDDSQADYSYADYSYDNMESSSSSYIDSSYADYSYEDYSYEDNGYAHSSYGDYSYNDYSNEQSANDYSMNQESFDYDRSDNHNFYSKQDSNTENINQTFQQENSQTLSTDANDYSTEENLNWDYYYNNEETSSDTDTYQYLNQQDLSNQYTNSETSSNTQNLENNIDLNTNFTDARKTSYDYKEQNDYSYNDQSYDNYETSDIKMKTDTNVYNQNQDVDVNNTNVQSSFEPTVSSATYTVYNISNSNEDNSNNAVTQEDNDVSTHLNEYSVNYTDQYVDIGNENCSTTTSTVNEFSNSDEQTTDQTFYYDNDYTSSECKTLTIEEGDRNEENYLTYTNYNRETNISQSSNTPVTTYDYNIISQNDESLDYSYNYANSMNMSGYQGQSSSQEQSGYCEGGCNHIYYCYDESKDYYYECSQEEFYNYGDYSCAGESCADYETTIYYDSSTDSSLAALHDNIFYDFSDKMAKDGQSSYYREYANDYNQGKFSSDLGNRDGSSLKKTEDQYNQQLYEKYVPYYDEYLNLIPDNYTLNEELVSGIVKAVLLIQKQQQEAIDAYNAQVLQDLQIGYKNTVGKLVIAFGQTVAPALDKGVEVLKYLGVPEGCDINCTAECYNNILYDDYDSQCVQSCGCEFEQEQAASSFVETSYWDLLYKQSQHSKNNAIKLFIENMAPAVQSFAMIKQNLLYEYYDKFYYHTIQDLGCNQRCIASCTNLQSIEYYLLPECAGSCSCTECNLELSSASDFDYASLMLFNSNNLAAWQFFMEHKDQVQ